MDEGIKLMGKCKIDDEILLGLASEIKTLQNGAVCSEIRFLFAWLVV